MRYNKKVLNSLLRLLEGETVYSAELGSFGQQLYNRGHFECVKYRGSHPYYKVKDKETFQRDLTSIDDSLRDIKRLIFIYENGKYMSRGEIAALNGDSKLKRQRTFHGFMVNSYAPVSAMISGKKTIIYPSPGTFTFVSDYKNFIISPSTVVIGIENPENFATIELQRKIIESAVRKVSDVSNPEVLFVSRYPQENSSNDLMSWLMNISNKYIHYGDFDLAGINIFHTEYYNNLGDRASFLIPENIEKIIAKGNKDRYWAQQEKYENSFSPIPSVQHLIDLIKKYERCFDQEGLEIHSYLFLLS